MKRLYSYLKSVFYFSLFTLSFFTSSAQAQDAFYVYRNDGDFNGFFFDQVKRMGYSKMDLDSIEHEEYVIQEIETTDSLYRIPLAAIDSIGFQQPEIRFSKKMIDIDANGLMDHYAALSARDRMLMFDKYKYYPASIPSDIVPKVGDVLISHDDRIRIEGAPSQLGLEEFARDIPYFESQGFFLGKVARVEENTAVYKVFYDYVDDIGDIFEQFISVEQVGYAPDGSVKRRIAGFNPDGTLRNSPRKTNGNVELTLFSFSGRLQHEWKPYQDVSFTVGLDLGMEAKLQATYAITGLISKRLFVKLDFKEKFSAGLSAVASVSTDAEIEIPTPLSVLPAIKFPAVFPIFEVDPIPKGFFRVHGQLDGKLALPQIEIGLMQSVTIDTDDPWLMSFEWRQQDDKGEYHIADGDFTDGEASLTFWGYMQGGVKSTLGLSTNSWLAKLLHAGIGLEIHSGPKVSGSISTNISNSYIEFAKMSIDRDLKYKWRVGSKKEERTLWSDTKTYDALRYYLTPEFNRKPDVDYNVTDHIATVTVYPSGNVFTQSRVGVALKLGSLYNNQELFSYGAYYHPTNKVESYTGTFHVDTLWAGSYDVYPCTTVDGVRYHPVCESSYFEIPYKEISTFPDTITIGCEGGSFSYDAVTNFPSYELYGDNGYYTADDGSYFKSGGVDYTYWLSAEAKRTSAGQGKAEYTVSFTAKGNPTKDERVERFKVGYFRDEKTIVVRQLPQPEED